MARSRNIKPGFLTNEDLAENNPLGRLLFLGFTMLADFKGDIEWRPKRIKIQTLPYDDCDIIKLAINLDNSGFIRFYSDGDKIYINIPNFLKHQNPHKNEREKGSDIPAYTDKGRQLVDLKRLTIIRDKKRGEREYSASDPADSLILNPSSLNPDSLDSSELPAHEPPPKFELILNTKDLHPVTEAEVLGLSELYPAVDVDQQFRNMIGWLQSNPTRRKTKNGISNFVNSWLSKEQNRAGSSNAKSNTSAREQRLAGVAEATYGKTANQF